MGRILDDLGEVCKRNPNYLSEDKKGLSHGLVSYSNHCKGYCDECPCRLC